MNPVRAGVLAGLTVAASVAVVFGPLAVSVPGGLLLAFVVPGLALLEAIFRPARRDIGAVERIVLVPALSLAVLVLGGLVLWSVGGTLNRTGWTLVCAVVTLVAVGVAVHRTLRVPAPEDSSDDDGTRAGRWRWRLSRQRLGREVAPLILAVLLLGVAGVWSYTDAVNTYDVEFGTLSAAPPGPVDADGNRMVQMTAAGLDAAAGPYTMVLTGTDGERISEQGVTPGSGGEWSGLLSVPGDERVTVGLFRGGESAAFRTLVIAAVQ